MLSIYEKIQRFNRNRDPEFVQVKYKLLTDNAFRFFRGTCHLFYEDLHKNISWIDDTKCWVSGDLHLENFGSYKGDNRVVYFDINDFDEALLAPASWELVRLLTSIHIGSSVLKLQESIASALCLTCIDAYIKTILAGKPKVIDKETATGLLQALLENVQKRKERLFIESRTSKDGLTLKLKMADGKIVKIEPGKKVSLLKEAKEIFKQDEILQKFKPVDIANRIAGTGSVGLNRYAVLVQGRQSLNYHLIDIKEASTSSLNPYNKIKQPEWPNEAERIITLQKRIQHVSPALLRVVKPGGKYFVLKELQPTQDRTDLALCGGNLKKLQSIITTMAEITASAQLRCTGRQGSSTTDGLIDFVTGTKKWKEEVLAYAAQYAKTVSNQYLDYCKLYKQQSLKM